MSLISTEDRDAATEPLLTNQPSSNLIVDFYSQKSTFIHAGSHGDSSAGFQTSRTLYSPQHPSQDLIEMLNRNQQLNQLKEDRKHRDKWCEKHRHLIHIENNYQPITHDQQMVASNSTSGATCEIKTRHKDNSSDAQCVMKANAICERLIDLDLNSCEDVNAQGSGSDKIIVQNNGSTKEQDKRNSTELALAVEYLPS